MTAGNGDLPGRWIMTTMGEVAEVVGGGTPKTTVSGNFDDATGHPWLTPADLTGHREKTISHGKRFLTDQGLKTSAAKYMPPGTILFSSRAPIGYVAIAANPVTTNQGFRSFVPSERLDSNYAYHYLRSIKDVAEQMASGTTFNELSGSKAKTLPIPLPPVDEQRRIAVWLDEMGARRSSISDRLAAARAIVDRLRTAVLAAACCGRLTTECRSVNTLQRVPQGPLLSTQAQRHASGAENSNNFTDIPESWGWWSVESIIAKVIDYRGRTPPTSDAGTIPHVRTTQLRDGRIDWHVDRFVAAETYGTYMTRGLPERGDVLFTMEAPLGEVGVVDVDEPFSIAQRILLLRPGDGLTGDYLALALRSPAVRRAIELRSTGSGVSGVAYKRLRSVLIPKPPLEEQFEIVRRAHAALKTAEELATALSRARDALERSVRATAAMAFRGEFAVVDDGELVA